MIRDELCNGSGIKPKPILEFPILTAISIKLQKTRVKGQGALGKVIG
jgi:hypothetical protein